MLDMFSATLASGAFLAHFAAYSMSLIELEQKSKQHSIKYMSRLAAICKKTLLFVMCSWQALA